MGVPITYMLANLLKQTGEPILWSVILYIAFSYVFIRLIHTSKSVSSTKLTASDVFIIIFAVIFSSWLMMKTFHGGAGGQLFVGSNNVFDFGHALGIVRSFSWGNNIPFMSPFQFGLPFFYHFFFYFFVAIWEYFGVPIVWAMNIPSILSFASLLIMVYFLPQVLLKQNKLTGWIAVLLTITHSTLTFWYLLIQKGFNAAFFHTIWRLPTYPFAGPFDGSTISVFMTLNNYVNQRHLAFGIALGFYLIMCLVKLLDDKRLSVSNSIVLGLLTGGMFFWNMPVSMLVGVIILLLMILKGRLRESFIYFLCVLGMVVLSILPFVSVWKNIWVLGMALQGVQAGKFVNMTQQWNIFRYLWENLGILPLVVCAGLFAIPKQRRVFIIPFIFMFIALCFYAVYVNHGFDQKFLSVLIIGANICAAYGVVWFFQRKNFGFRLLSLTILFILMVSGLVDLMAVKNEFAFPLTDRDTSPVISWIKNYTKRDAVFASYSDIIDPVVLAGRKNYFGFFGNIGAQDRSSTLSAIYQGDLTIAAKNSISYILVPKWNKNDFPYIVNDPYLRLHGSVVYESDRYRIFHIGGVLQ